MAQHKNSARYASALFATLLLAGCATVQNPNPQDPWESVNRGVYVFNGAIDGALIKPVTLMYKDLTPKPVRSCVSNIFGNLGDVWSAFNSFLQGRGHDFVNTLGRVLFNSTVGLGGCIDVATTTGATRIENDLGVTLGVWGVGSGPYVVLPFLGSSTVRDGVATASLALAQAGSTQAIMEIENIRLRNTILGLYAIDARASVLDAEALIDEIALDRYSFVRDAYLQKRQSLINRYHMVLPDYDDEPDDEDSVPQTVARQ